MLDEADFFETAHKSAAQSGQSAVPTDLENVEEHFITFIEAENDKGSAAFFWSRDLADVQRETSGRDGRWSNRTIRQRTMLLPSRGELPLHDHWSS